MKVEGWLLPEGVEEVLPPSAARLERLRRRVLDRLDAWGYELVIPPFIEYLDTLLTGTGTDLDLQTFKLIDQLSGRTMGVRADMTPQVARIDARLLRREGPTRLCYLGTVLRARPEGPGGGRCPVQLGAELYGHRGMESDCEVLALMLEVLDVAGVGPVHLDLGHVGIFRALAARGGFDEETEAELHDALQRKAADEIAAVAEQRGLAAGAVAPVAALAGLNGGAEVIDLARERLGDALDAVGAHLDALERLGRAIAERRPGLPVHYDLAELRGYRYHTGVVFAALVPGHGQEVARGGRYDDIGRVFGRPRPATGFSTDLKVLLALGEAPAGNGRGAIAAPFDADPALAALVADLRASGERVVQRLPGDGEEAAACDRELRREGGAWRVVARGAGPASGGEET